MFKELITTICNLQIQNASLNCRLFVLTACLEIANAIHGVSDAKERENVPLFDSCN